MVENLLKNWGWQGSSSIDRLSIPMIFYKNFQLDNTRRNPGGADRVFVLKDLDEVKNLDILIPPAVSSQSVSQSEHLQKDTSRAKI